MMSFGLTNVSVTFCNMINDMVYKYLDAFIVVYLDDVVTYSKTLQEDSNHLKLVFQRLIEYKLYVERGKCQFT